jgi:peptide deformylase
MEILMAVRSVIEYSDHKVALRQKSKAVARVNQKVHRLIQDLKDTLNAGSGGIGLAAPQLNIHKRVVAVCLGLESDGEWQAGPPIALINPEIVEASDERVDFDGCLSFPNLYGETIRPHHLRVTGLDEMGQPLNRVCDSFNAVLVHHEIDHLNGVLFIDRIASPQSLYAVREDEAGNMVRVATTLEDALRPTGRSPAIPSVGTEVS